MKAGPNQGIRQDDSGVRSAAQRHRERPLTGKGTSCPGQISTGGAAETSELFRQARAIVILLKPTTFFHCNSTASVTLGLDRRAGSTRWYANSSKACGLSSNETGRESI